MADSTDRLTELNARSTALSALEQIMSAAEYEMGRSAVIRAEVYAAELLVTQALDVLHDEVRRLDDELTDIYYQRSMNGEPW